MKELSKYINTYCTGCGLCHSVQGTELKMIEGGFPNVDVKKGESLEFYHSVCPVFYYKGKQKHDIWGNIEKALIGYSSNKKIRFISKK